MSSVGQTPDSHPALSTAALAGWAGQLSGLTEQVDNAERIAQLRLLEHLKSACAAAQAVITHAFVSSVMDEAGTSGPDREAARRSAAAQVALARQESPIRGRRHVGLAAALVQDMPCTLEALRTGAISEWRATVVTQEVGCLTATDRMVADAQVGPVLGQLSDHAAAGRAAAIAYRLDPQAVMGRVRGATGDRRVSIRPAPDTMARISALLPVADGVAAYAALTRFADSAMSCGDGRSRNQVMADEFVARLVTPLENERAVVRRTSTEPAVAGTTGTVPAVTDPAANGAGDTHVTRRGTSSRPTRGRSIGAGALGGVHINLVMTDRTLLDGDSAPAILLGYGPIPAPLARRLVMGGAEPDDPGGPLHRRNSAGERDRAAAKVWVRRCYARAEGAALISMESRARLFPAAARRFLIARDQVCRTPWCGAPIRDVDHVTDVARGGPTSVDNGQGLCRDCNLTKAAPGWSSVALPDGEVHLRTPTGDSYRTIPPPAPASLPWAEESGSARELVPESANCPVIDIRFPWMEMEWAPAA